MTITFRTSPLRLLATLVAVILATGTVITGESLRLGRELLQQVERKFGRQAYNRLVSWEDLMQQGGPSTDREKLERVNRFFNSSIRFVSDVELWGVQDYWATPIELLSRGAGDCEDFAIAKYFTLRAMGIPDEKLRITYVKSIQHNIHHMVLTYYATPEAEPVVLDNLIDSVSPASRRTDLMPIFTFNGTGLWTAKQRGQGKMAGSSNRIRLWKDLLQKMSENRL